MSEPGLIVQPPRAFQFVAFVAFDADARTDAQLSQYILDNIGPSFSLARNVRGIVVNPIAAVPAGVTPK